MMTMMTMTLLPLADHGGLVPDEAAKHLGMSFIPETHPAYGKAVSYLTLEVYDVGTQDTETFLNYAPVKGGILAPRDYASKLGLYPEYVTSGYSLEEDCFKPIQLRDEQVPFVDSLEMLSEMPFKYDGNPFIDIRAEAATGKGKTVMALELCRRLQLTTLIIVDQEFLRDQWIERATDLFGVDPDEIGLVQGKVEDWEGRSIVIGMVQSLYDRDMPAAFWEYFGVAIFDESHTIGARKFSRVMNNIPAVIRIGLSATSERTDVLEEVLRASLGDVQLYLEAQHATSILRYVDYNGQSFSWYANSSPKSGRYLSEIAMDGQRNNLIARIIKRLYKDGHHVLAISDRVEQCEDVGDMLYYMGIPDEDIGIVTGFKTEYRWVKNDSPSRRPRGYVRGTEYTPVSLQRVRRRSKAAELNHAKDNARIVLATYGKFEKGVDVPRLSAGIDMTPRSKAVQVHGRILREHKGKKTPVWVTISDTHSFRSQYQFANRIGEYVKSNAEVYQWELGSEPVKQNANQVAAAARRLNRMLRERKIVKKLDGNYTVSTQSIERKSNKRHGAPIGKTTRSARTS
jgi:superfamily II DNA or RNA helicase